MARPANVQRIVFRGTLPGGEVWSTAFWTRINGNTGTAQQVADNIAGLPAFGNLLTAAKALMSVQAALTAIDVYQYRNAGTAATGKGTANVANGQGTGSNLHPNTVAAVMTLRTADPSGSGRGRMYWPATGMGMEETGRFSPARLNDLRFALAALLSTQESVVVSPTRSTSYLLTSVDNDYVPDTIRARSDKLTSTRGSSVVTPNA